VLAAAYEWDRATIHGRVRRPARTRKVVIEALELVERALDEYAAGKAQLADYLILGKARSGAGRILTFDKKLAREEDASLL
jgi:predicted nucleic-acid-binding protein